MTLTKHTIFITGGASGIGLALGQAFLKEGNSIIVCGRDIEKLAKLKTDFPQISTIVCDISKEEEREKLTQTIKTKYPSLNMLINNAGIQLNYNFLEEQEHQKEIAQELEVNLLAPLLLTDKLLPILLTNPNPSIVNISSALAFVPKESSPVYCASKSAIHSFSKALRYQLEGKIKVFEVIPPLVDTNMTKGRGKGKISPKTLAKEVLEGIASDNYEIKVSKAKILLWINKCLPFLAERIIRKG